MKKICLLLLVLISCNPSTRTLWRWTLQSRCYADPVIDGRTLYVVSAAGEVVAGDSDNGTRIWSQKLPGAIVAAPAVSDRLLFVATQEGDVFALEKKTGNEIWRKRFAGDGVEAPLLWMKEQLLVPSVNGILYSLSPENGEMRWSYSGTGKYNTAPLGSGSLIFIGGWAGRFLCLSSNGQLQWEFRAGERITENALLQKNRIFVSTDNRYVYAFDAPSGKFLWRFKAEDPTNLIVIRNELVFGSGSSLFVLRPEDGSLLRKLEVPKRVSRIYASGLHCLVIADRVYEVDPSGGHFSAMELPAVEAPFKLAFSSTALIVTNQLYSVFAFPRN